MRDAASEPTDGQAAWWAADCGVPRRLPGGHILVRAGEPAHSVYLVRHGQVRTSVVGSDGRETTTAILGPGQLVGISPLLRRAVHHEFAQTLGPVDVWCLRADRLLCELPTNRDLLGLVVGALAQRLAQCLTLLADVALGTVSDRIAHAEQFLAQQPGGPPRLNKRSFSDLIGIRPETLSRAGHPRPLFADEPAGPVPSPATRTPVSNHPQVTLAGAPYAEVTDDLAAAMATLNAHRFGPGERIPLGSANHAVYIVQHGCVWLLLEDQHDRRIIVDQVESGCLGLAHLATPHQAKLVAEVVTAAAVWRLASNDVLCLFDDHPRVGCRVVVQTAQRLIRVEQLLHRAHAPTARARVASLLLELSRREGPSTLDGSRYLPRGWTHQALAQAIGARRETVTRALRVLTAEGHLRRDGQRLVVRDAARLAGDLGLDPT